MLIYCFSTCMHHVLVMVSCYHFTILWTIRDEFSMKKGAAGLADTFSHKDDDNNYTALFISMPK